MADVHKLNPVEIGESFRFDPDELLEAAKGQDFTNLVILGELPNGETWVSGIANAGESLIMIERAKRIIVFGED